MDVIQESWIICTQANQRHAVQKRLFRLEEKSKVVKKRAKPTVAAIGHSHSKRAGCPKATMLQESSCRKLFLITLFLMWLDLFAATPAIGEKEQ